MRPRLVASGICEEGCPHLLRNFLGPGFPQRLPADFAAIPLRKRLQIFRGDVKTCALIIVVEKRGLLKKL